MSRKANCKCVICGKEIYKNPNHLPKIITCGRTCRKIAVEKFIRKSVICDNCGVNFTKKPSRSNSKKHYCSSKCVQEAISIKYNIYDAAWLHHVGYYDHEIAILFNCSRVWVTKGLNSLNITNRKSKINDLELRERLSKANAGKRTGSDNHNYKGKGDYTTLARGLFHAISTQVKRERNYTCEECGKRGGDLHTHHIKSFASIVDEFLSLNLDISYEDFSKQILEYQDFIDKNNLILLCKKCHMDIYHKTTKE